MQRFGNLRGILDASPEDLYETEGIGSVTPISLKVIRAMSTLYLQQVAEETETLSDLTSLSAFWRMRIGGMNVEVFQVAYLNTGYRLMREGVETLEEGTVDRATVYPQRVIESALRRGAAALVLAHNHPNENVQPSEQDKILTRALVLAAETVHLKIVDHLIISKDAV